MGHLNWRGIALGAQAAMLLYFVVDNYVDLYPWNNLAVGGNQLPSTLMGCIPFALVMLAVYLNIRWGIVIGCAWSYVWLALQLWTWWVPYVFGLHRDWYVAHGYEATLKILPVLPNRPTPDLQHNVLQLLSLAVVVSLTRLAMMKPVAPA